jgi:pyridoxal phosphate enzyme (YggS family)
MAIDANIRKIKEGLPENVRLVAVSKTKPAEEILEAYEAGQRLFGENKALEMAAKYEVLPKDIEWHFIGHLQTNKVKYIAPFVAMIHSVDSQKLLAEINKEAQKAGRVIPCLLQFHIADEETKFGLSMEQAREIFDSEKHKKLGNISPCGVMGMATFTNDFAQVRSEFRKLRLIFETLSKNYFKESADFCEISMGMSDDYQVAIEEGSTLVRVGSKIFGIRNYD